MASPPPAVGAPAGRTARRKCIGRFNLNYLNAPFYGRFCHTTALLKISVWDAGKNYKALSCNYKGLRKNYKGLRKNYKGLGFIYPPDSFSRVGFWAHKLVIKLLPKVINVNATMHFGASNGL